MKYRELLAGFTDEELGQLIQEAKEVRQDIAVARILYGTACVECRFKQDCKFLEQANKKGCYVLTCPHMETELEHLRSWVNKQPTMTLEQLYSRYVDCFPGVQVKFLTFAHQVLEARKP